VNFTYNVNDSQDINNCSLLLNGSVHVSSITVEKGINQSFNNIPLANSEYNWSVQCFDKTGNYGSSPTYSLTVNAPLLNVYLEFPGDLSGDNDGSIEMRYNYSGGEGPVNCSLVLNSLLNTTDYGVEAGVTHYFSIGGLSAGRYNWSVNCSGSTLSASSPVRYFDVILSYSFGGATTNLSTVADTSNISGLTVESYYGRITYTEPVNLSGGADLNSLINISHNFSYVNSSAEPRLNRHANISFYGLPFRATPIVLKDDGLPCHNCTVLSYSGGNLSFNVTGFSGYVASANSRLEVWDDNDTGAVIYVNQTVGFYANYTNATDGQPVVAGAYCNYSHNQSGQWSTPVPMIYNATSRLYEYRRNFSYGGAIIWNISCSGSGYEPLSLLDDVSIAPASNPPVIYFDSLTRLSNQSTNRPWLWVNASINVSGDSTGFIDFNRSLVLWMRFNNNTDYADHSTWGNNGINHGTVYASAGRFGGAMNFSSSYISAGNSSSLSLGYPCTLEAWVNVYQHGNNVILAKNDSYALMLTPDGTVQFWIKNSEGGKFSITTVDALSIGQWYLLTAEYSSGGLSIFINGAESSRMSSILTYGLYNSGQNVTIGAPMRDGVADLTRSFRGRIDEVRIWNRDLSADEIHSGYNSTYYGISRNFSTGIVNGTYMYSAYVQDVSGAVNSVSAENVTVDTVKPLILYNSTSTPEGVLGSNSIYINVKATDLHLENVTLEWDGENESFDNTDGIYYWEYKTDLTAGTYTVRAYASDFAGNLNYTTLRTYYLTDAPILLYHDPTPLNGSSLTQDWAAINISIKTNGDALDTFSFNLNASNYTVYSPSLAVAYNFDNNTLIGENSTLAVDISSTSSTNATCSGYTCPAYSSGIHGGAYLFDGGNDFLDLGDSSDIDLGTSYTIMGYFRPNQGYSSGSGSYQTLLDKASYQLFLDKSDGKLKFYEDPGGPHGWSALGSGPGASTTVLCPWNGSLYAGGDSPVNNYISRWNGSAWSSVGGGVDGIVRTIVTWNGSLYVGGNFENAGGVPAKAVARWNGSAWSAVGSGFSSSGIAAVYALAVWNGSLYAAGKFNSSGMESVNGTARWNGTNWVSLGSGLFVPNADYIYTLAVYNGSLYAGGTFTSIGGVFANRIAKWDGTAWSALGPGLSSAVWSSAVWNNSLCVGGPFAYAGDTSVNCTACWNGSAWRNLGTGFTPASDYVWGMSVYNGNLYVAGNFRAQGR